MDVTAVILHKQAFAYYTVTEKAQGQLAAHLVSYSGLHSDAPQPFLQLAKDHPADDRPPEESELICSIRHAVAQEMERRKVVQLASGTETTFLPAMNVWSII